MRIIIDVREPEEYQKGHVDLAINIPPSELLNNPKQLEGIDKDTELILYCISGARSNATMHYLKQLGFTNVVNGVNKDHVEKLLSD